MGIALLLVLLTSTVMPCRPCVNTTGSLMSGGWPRRLVWMLQAGIKTDHVER